MRVILAFGSRTTILCDWFSCMFLAIFKTIQSSGELMNIQLLETMLELSRQMAQTRDIEQLLNLAMEKTIEIIGAERCYLVVVNEQDELDFRARSVSEKDQREDDILSRTILNSVLDSGEPLITSNALSDPRFSSTSSIESLQLRSVMCVPLLAGGKTMGAIYVENRHISGAFRQEDVKPLIFFANQAAVCIENAMIIRNLEERVAARTEALEHNWREAVEANKVRTSLLGQLAHDMRSPATVVMMALSNLKNPRFGDINEMQERWIERGLHGITQMNELVENIFDLSKVEMNALEINKKPVELLPFLSRIYEIGMALPWESNVRFEKELPEDLPTLMIDTVRIQQVLMNLISNAMKFTHSGSVTIHAEEIEQGIKVGVRDTGEGIPDIEQAKIFDRFHQFDRDDKRRTSGAGLGLAICRELIEKHDGRIWVESTPDVGSDFVFVLPY